MQNLSFRNGYHSLLLVVVCGLGSACGENSKPPDQTAKVPDADLTGDLTGNAEVAEQTMTTSEPGAEDPSAAAEPDATGTGEVPAAAMEQVLADFVAKTGAAAGEYSIQSARQQQWPDGGMGCAPLDEVHTQIPVRGYQVIIMHQGARYDYRISEDNQLRLCQLLLNRRNNSAPTQ